MKTRLHRPAIRRRGPRRIRAPVPARRRTARRQPRRRSAHDLRARLRHLEERVPGRRGPRRGVTVRRFATAATRDIDAFNAFSERIYHKSAQPRRRDGVAEAAGTVEPGLIEYLRPQPSAVRRPDLLHLPVCADGAGLEMRRSAASSCRPRTTSRRSSWEIFKEVFASRPRSANLPRASAVRRSPVSRIGRCSRRRRRRHRHAAAAGLPAHPGAAARRRQGARRGGEATEAEATRERPRRSISRRISSPAARCSAAAPFATARWSLYGGPHRPGQGLRRADQYFTST